jgi:symplekin
MSESPQAGGNGATEMWMLLLVRMVTRVANPSLDEMNEGADGGERNKGDDANLRLGFYSRQDRLRQTLCDYIMSDFPARYVGNRCINSIYLIYGACLEYDSRPLG